MLTRPLPERVDHRKLVNDGAILQGAIPLLRFTRLLQSLEGDSGYLTVSLEFRKGRKHKSMVIGEAKGDLSLVCQTCLAPVTYLVDVKVQLSLVKSESELCELELREDGLVVESALVPLVDFYEDELIVNLPMIPRHEEGKCHATLHFVNEFADERIAENVGESPGDGPGNGKARPFAELSEMRSKARKSRH